VSRYKVLVDDNFDYMDQDKRYQHGVFPIAEEAISACKRIVDSNLNDFMQPGMTASELYGAYPASATTLSLCASMPMTNQSGSRHGTMRRSGAGS
jgi:hypothetical protein